MVLLYADDLLIIIKCPPAEAVVVILLAMRVLQLFTDHSGLHINHSKSALLLKGVWTNVQVSQLIPTKLPIVFGHVNEDTLYEPALQKALGRAFAMQSWALSFPERVMLLKLWILPLLVFLARVVFPTDNVINTLKIVYNVALRLTSWDLTHNILALPRNEGGYPLPQPKTFLYRQHSTVFVQYVKDPLPLLASVTASFKRFALLHGMSLRKADLPFFQMGSNVVWRTMPYVAWSCLHPAPPNQGRQWTCGRHWPGRACPHNCTISYTRLFGKSFRRGNANKLGNLLIHIAPLITPWKQSHTACTNAPFSNMPSRSSNNASRWTFHIFSYGHDDHTHYTRWCFGLVRSPHKLDHTMCHQKTTSHGAAVDGVFDQMVLVPGQMDHKRTQVHR